MATPNTSKHTLKSLCHVLIVHTCFRHIQIKNQKVWRKNLSRFGFYEKNLEEEVNIPPPTQNRVKSSLSPTEGEFVSSC